MSWLTNRLGREPDERFIQRFWKYVDISGGSDACWPWLGYINKITGYGQFNIKPGVHSTSHRIAYSLSGEETLQDKDDLVLHRCDNRPCCNPAHLHIGSALANAHEMILRGRAYHPPRLKGEDSPDSKLMNADVRMIRQLHQTGTPGTVLAKQFGVGRTTIGRIISGRSYSTA